MKHLINMSTEGIDAPWVTYDNEGIVHYSGGVSEEKDPVEFVDLGLPSGLLWASCNVGANKPEEYGLLFQWGATEGHDYDTDAKDYSTWGTCPWGSSTPPISTLDAEHDAATVAYGEGYRIPTQAEFNELTASTTSEWTTVNGVNGRKFTSKSDSSKYIFIPAAGHCNDGLSTSVGYGGFVWTSSLFPVSPLTAWYLNFNSGYVTMSGDYYRYSGFSVRAVKSKA